MKICKSTCKGFEQVYSAVRYSLHVGNNPKDSRMMNNRDIQNYFVSLVKWVKNNYEAETLQEMIVKGVPDKKIRSKVPSRY